MAEGVDGAGKWAARDDETGVVLDLTLGAKCRREDEGLHKIENIERYMQRASVIHRGVRSQQKQSCQAACLLPDPLQLFIFSPDVNLTTLRYVHLRHPVLSHYPWFHREPRQSTFFFFFFFGHQRHGTATPPATTQHTLSFQKISLVPLADGNLQSADPSVFE